MLPQSSEPQKPTVWGWYVTYCIAMAVLNMIVVFVGFAVLLGPTGANLEPGGREILGFVYIVLGFALLIPYVAGPLLPRRKWAWVMGLVLICFGMTSLCCLPAAIPLLIWWIKPETKDYYYHGGPGAETSAKPLTVAYATHRKCPGCGLNNLPTAVKCDRCDAPLAS